MFEKKIFLRALQTIFGIWIMFPVIVENRKVSKEVCRQLNQAGKNNNFVRFLFLRTMWSSLKYDFQLDINLKGIKDYLLNDTSIVKSSI